MNRKIDLEARMEQYGAMAQGQIGTRHTLGEIAGYAAAIGAGLAMVGTADAAIVYSGVQPNGGLLNGGSVKLSNLPASPVSTHARTKTSVASIAGNKVSGFASLSRYSSFGSTKYEGSAGIRGQKMAFMGTSEFSFFGASRLANGDAITAGASFSASTAGALITSSGSTYGHFLLPNNSGFVGFKFTSGANSGDLGWIQLQVDWNSNEFPDGVKVTGWAYNDVAGESILAGDTGTQTVPDPSSLALLAAGALGLAAFRRRKAARAN